MGDLKDDEAIDLNRLKPRELLVLIYEKVEGLEHKEAERAKMDVQTKLDIQKLQLQMEQTVDERASRKGTIYGIISGGITALITALLTKLFGV